MVLKCPRDDLGRARGALVHQHDHRQPGPRLLSAGTIGLGRAGRPPLHFHDYFAAIQEQVGDGHALVEDATRVRPEIEDERPRALGLQIGDGLPQLLGRGFAHGGDADVPDPGGQDHGFFHEVHVDSGACYGEADRLWDPCPRYRQDDVRTGLSTHDVRGLLCAPAFGGCAVDLDDLIARCEAGPFARCVGERRHHRDPTVAGVYLNTHAAVVPRGAQVEFLDDLGAQIRGIRVVQAVEHPFDGHFIEIIGIE